MKDPRIARMLALGPARRFIKRTSRYPIFRKLYERLSGAACVHASMDAARDAIRRHRPETCGHLEEKLIGSNFTLSLETRMSDYPVLFWLLNISREEDLRVFDFGGGVGQTFVNFSRMLPDGKLVSWTVQDLVGVIQQGKARFHSGGVPERMQFSTSLGDAADCNVFYVAGALHYWERPLSELLWELGTPPKHFIINRSPMSEAEPCFCTVQEGVDWAVACKVRSLAGLKAEMEAEGYILIDSWIDTEKTLTLPWLPANSCPYRGAYFRKDGKNNT